MFEEVLEVLVQGAMEDSICTIKRTSVTFKCSTIHSLLTRDSFPRKKSPKSVLPLLHFTFELQSVSFMCFWSSTETKSPLKCDLIAQSAEIFLKVLLSRRFCTPNLNRSPLLHFHLSVAPRTFHEVCNWLLFLNLIRRDPAENADSLRQPCKRQRNIRYESLFFAYRNLFT